MRPTLVLHRSDRIVRDNLAIQKRTDVQTGERRCIFQPRDAPNRQVAGPGVCRPKNALPADECNAANIRGIREVAQGDAARIATDLERAASPHYIEDR